MKKYQSGSTSDAIRTAASMLLFLIFAASMLVIIATAASTYSRISAGFDSSLNTSAAVRYISNKIRNSDNVTILDSGVAAESGGIISVISFKNGGIYEKNISASAEITTEGGEKIFSAEELKITLSDGLYHINITNGGEQLSALIGGR